MNRKRIEKILHNCSKTIDESVNRVGASNEIVKYIENLEQQVEKLQEENKKQKEVINKAREELKKGLHELDIRRREKVYIEQYIEEALNVLKEVE